MGFNSMNSAPKPFGSVAAPVTNKPSPAPYQPPAPPAQHSPAPYNPPAPPAQPSPAPYNPPAQHSPAAYNPPPPAPMVDNLSQQTSNMNINAGNNFASKYSNVEEKQGPGSHQSRSFKFLQDTLDSGQDPPAALRPTVDLRRSPSPHANAISATTGPSGVQKQFNSPIGLYSSANIPSQLPPPPAEMINDKSEGISNSGLDEEPAMKFDAQGKRLYRPSETFKLIHEQENPSSEPQDKQPEVKQTRTIRVLEKQLGDALPAPAAAKAPSAPKPGVWSPAGGSSAPPASAPAMRSFTQNAGPAAPPPSQAAPPRSAAAPPKPTGVGAVRGNIGDAVVKKNETGLVPVCTACGSPIRGPFVTAMGKSWCPDHFICANPRCGNKLMDMGFVEESGFLYCEKDYEMYFAPKCTKCVTAIVGECVNALNKQYHPACFLCHHCKQPIGGTQFHLEEGNPYCEIDWRQLFQTMCSSCNFPIEPGDKWVEALSNNYHSECFNCSTCQVNLEGQAFYAKTGKPYCKKHAR